MTSKEFLASLETGPQGPGGTVQGVLLTVLQRAWESMEPYEFDIVAKAFFGPRNGEEGPDA